MANLLQEALQTLNDEELERFSFVGSTLKGNFAFSTSGGKLRNLTNRAHLAGNAYMHATTAVGLPAFTTATLPAHQRGMILLAGADVAFTGIVRVDVQHPQHTAEFPFFRVPVCVHS